MDLIDGNIAAYEAYERRNQAIDEAWECVMQDLSPLLADLETIIDQCYACAENDMAELVGVDFTDSIREEIENIINQ